MTRGIKTRAGETWTEAFRYILLEHFYYDETTGDLYKIKDTRCCPKRKLSRCPQKNGYLQVQSKLFSDNGLCKTQYAHRLIFFLREGYLPENVDHINGIRDDNRWCNLRQATNSSNQLNRHVKVGKDKDLPVGVYRRKRKGRNGIWYAVRYQNGEIIKNTFKRNKEDAINQRLIWEDEYGEQT